MEFNELGMQPSGDDNDTQDQQIPLAQEVLTKYPEMFREVASEGETFQIEAVEKEKFLASLDAFLIYKEEVYSVATDSMFTLKRLVKDPGLLKK